MPEPITMTRAQYQATYGAPPVIPIPPVQTPQVDQTPIQMTKAQYQATYGAPPASSYEIAMGQKNSDGTPNTTKGIIPGVVEQYKKDINSPDGNVLEKGIQATSGVFGAIGQLPVLKQIGEVFGKGVNFAGEQLSKLYTPEFQNSLASMSEEDYTKATQPLKNLQNLGTIANTILMAKGGQKGGEVASKVANETGNIIDKGINSVESTVNEITNSLPKLNPSETDIIVKQSNALADIEKNNGPVRREVASANSKGIDVRNIVSNTDLLKDSIDESGTIRTTEKGGAIDQFNQRISPYESMISDGLAQENKSISLADVEKALYDKINSSRIAGGSKTRLVNMVKEEINGLKLDSILKEGINPEEATPADYEIPLNKIQDAKISTNNGIDYTRPESKINAKMVANTYKTLIENNSDLPVADINASLSKLYHVRDYLEILDGKKVAGGKLGKYFAQTVGGIAGSHFGPLGTIIGAELAGKIKGTIMENTFGKVIGKDIEIPQILKDNLQKNQENNLGNLK